MSKPKKKLNKSTAGENVKRNTFPITYYRSLSFWKASAAVNLPKKIDVKHYRGINGFDSRCSAYGVILARLTEHTWFEYAKIHEDKEIHRFPEGYDRNKKEQIR